MALTPKNWSEFQHYKDRKPAWIKLHRTLLDDYEFACLPLASRALAPLLWLLASEYEDGEITCSDDALAFRLRMSVKELRIALNPLVEHGFFTSDSALLADCKQGASLEKERETEKEKNICAVATATRTTEFDEFWKAKPKRKGANPRIPALRAFERAVKSGCDPGEIVAAAKKWAADEGTKPGTEFVPMAVTWLNQRRFEEYQSTPEDAARSAVSDEFMRAKGFVWDGEKWARAEA